MKKLILAAGLSVIAGLGFAQNVHSGQYAAQLTRTSGAADSGLDKDNPSLRLPVTPGNQIQLSFWAKNGQAGASTFQRVSFAFFDAGGIYISATGDINYEEGTALNAAWTQYTETPFTVPATAATVNVAFRIGLGSIVVLDDVSLIDLTASNAQLMVNGGFETWTGAATAAPDNWRFFGGTAGSIQRLEQAPLAAETFWSLYE